MSNGVGDYVTKRTYATTNDLWSSRRARGLAVLAHWSVRQKL